MNEGGVDSSFELTVRDSPTGLAVAAFVRRIGPDLVIVVGGGASPHVGCAVLAQPVPSRTRPGSWTPSCSVLTIPPHKEEPIARRVAEAACRVTGGVVLVTAGIHDDGLDHGGVETYLRLGDDLADRLAAMLG